MTSTLRNVNKASIGVKGLSEHRWAILTFLIDF